MCKLPISSVVLYSLYAAYILSLILFMNKKPNLSVFEWSVQRNNPGSYAKWMNATFEPKSSTQDELNVVTSIERKYVNKQVVQSQLEHAITNERRITTGFVNASSVVPSNAGNRSIEHKYSCVFGAIPLDCHLFSL